MSANNGPLSLKGMNVLIPRGKHHAKSFSGLVASYGGNPVEIPLIAFRPVITTPELQMIYDQLHTYDWIIFTSNVTVETFFAGLEVTVDIALPKIAVIGENTKSIVIDKGLPVDFTPQEYVAEGFVKEFLPFVKRGMKVIIPKGNLARDYIASSLVETGTIVKEIIVYETFFPEESKKLLQEKLSAHAIDILPFTSPSTVDHLMEFVEQHNLQQAIDRCIIGCIGPVTKKRAEAYGLKIHAVPEVYTVHNMLKKIMMYIEA